MEKGHQEPSRCPPTASQGILMKVVRGDFPLCRSDNLRHMRGPRGSLPTGVPMDSLTRNADIASKAGNRGIGGCEKISEFHGSECVTTFVTSQLETSQGLCIAQPHHFGYASNMTWLDYYLSQKGIKDAQLARESGENRQTIGRLRKGTTDMSVEWAAKLAPHLGVEPENLLFGPASNAKLSVQNVPIRGEAAAGRWVEADDLDQGRYKPVSAVAGEYAVELQFAYRIAGPSMDQRRIWDGDYVVCVPYWEARSKAKSGDIVIVEQRRGQLIETTCKELVVTDKGYELWPRSSNPKWQEPIVIPHMNDPHALDGTEIEITGLVIGLFARLS